MRVLKYSNRFIKDFKRCSKRGYDKAKLDIIRDALSYDIPMPPAARPHNLTGNWAGHTECHIAPDWLLVYKIDDDGITLVATGTHSDLF
ncbi:MAG: type II toxin-antitoxin system YafQ family toxin [Rickettsiales bacterium]|jgi:mRNA interferase YafQ|nr:type II toxin-antitoxin system YafQ family toxin [Rickettsiales bacterium]